MGLFSRKDQLGEFVIDHYRNGDLVFHTDLNPNCGVIQFAFYFGKTVYDLGERRGTQLWKRLFATSSDVFETKVKSISELEPENRLYPEQTRFRVVSSSTGTDYLRETVVLFQKGDMFFCETESTPSNYPQIEDTVADGMEALFVHMFNSGPRDVKLFLPVVIMAQCNWYQQNGFPSMLSFNAAPYHGITTMMQIADQAQCTLKACLALVNHVGQTKQWQT